MKQPEPPSVLSPEEKQQASIGSADADLLHRTADSTPGEPRPKRVRRSAFFTSTPDVPPPHLLCPSCDSPLAYRHTVLSGVKPIERWDYFDCRTCGAFVYRDRTRKLRPAM
jgi:hypothetical protein